MKKLFFKYFWIALFSSITIGLLSFLNFKFDYGLFLIGSFGASVVLIFGFPSSPFSKKRNIFFGHFLTSLAGIIVLEFLPFSVMTLIPIAVGLGIFMMLLFNVAHPPAGGNAIILILGEYSYNFLLNPIMLGTIILIVMGIFYNFISSKYSIFQKWKDYYPRIFWVKIVWPTKRVGKLDYRGVDLKESL